VCPDSTPAPALLPRLLDVKKAGEYLGVSAWTVRHSQALQAARVELPGLSKKLYDRLVLDQLVGRWRVAE
jgi:hypothetical protein